jgi:hypothetical protein
MAIGAVPAAPPLRDCHICPGQLLNQQPLSFSFLSFVAYLAGINFLDLTPKGCLLSQHFFAGLHPAFTSFPILGCKVGSEKWLVKAAKAVGRDRQPPRRLRKLHSG